MIEIKLIKKFPIEIIAVDEVGRGPLCGPVVIGAFKVQVNNQVELKAILKNLKKIGVADSKKISDKDRSKVLLNLGINSIEFNKKQKIKLGGTFAELVTWSMDHKVIDQENILAATLRGMKEASLFLSEMKNESTIILIDGHLKFRWGNDQAPTWEEVPLVKGDSKSLCIGLASIVAKVKRDDFMKKMHALYPEYNLDQNAGYPTAHHREAIKKYGPSPIHRKTFKGVKEFIRAD